MKVLFLLKYSSEQASSRIRGFYIAEELKRLGFDCKIISPGNGMSFLTIMKNLFKYDIIIFQKRYSKGDIKLNRLARLLNKKTVFDIDDHPGGSDLEEGAKKKAIAMMKASSVVFAGSNKLMEFARKFHHRVYLIPSSINLTFYKPKVKFFNDKCINLGWVGNGLDYKHDLLMLTEPIQKVAARFNVNLTIIGALGQKEIYNSFGNISNMQTKIINALEWSNPLAVPSAISEFHIGLYPLLDREYTQYKCGYKALEYMSMCVPVVASPVGENMVIIEDRINGFLAANTDEWISCLLLLIQNRNIRKNIGISGREKVKKYYSQEVVAKKIAAILQESRN